MSVLSTSKHYILQSNIRVKGLRKATFRTLHIDGKAKFQTSWQKYTFYDSLQRLKKQFRQKL